MKEDGLILNQELNPISLSQWQKRLNTLLRHGQLPREEDGALEFWRFRRLSSEEEPIARRLRQQRKDFKIVLTRQDKKVFISELFKVIQAAIPLILHSRTMLILNNFFEYIHHIGCAISFTLHHKFRIDTGRTKLKQGKTDSILYGCESHGQGTQRSVQAWLDQTTFLHGTSRRSGKDTRTRCIGSIHSLLNLKDWSSIKQDVLQSIILYDTLSACCISKVVVMEYGQIIYEKVYASPSDHLQRFPSQIIGWKNWIQK